MRVCPTLRRLLDMELRLLQESQYEPEHSPLVKEWERALAGLRRIYQGYLEEPDWLRFKTNTSTQGNKP